MASSARALVPVLLTLFVSRAALGQDAATPPAADAPRVRFGVDLAPVIGTTGWEVGLGGALHVRVGVQINDLFSVQYQAAGLLELGLPPIQLGSVSATSGATLLHTSSVVAELTIDDFVQVAVGPSLGVGGQQAPRSPAMQLALGPGFTARLALSFGGQEGRPRRGFSLGLQVDFVYADPDPPIQTAVFVGGVTLGWESF